MQLIARLVKVDPGSMRGSGRLLWASVEDVFIVNTSTSLQSLLALPLALIALD